jgi:hypothetical protein
LLNNVAACCLSDTEIFPERLPSARFPAVNVSGLWCTVLMNAPLLDPGPDPHPYGEALGVVEMLERRQREMDAARVTLIAAALDQVVEAEREPRDRLSRAAGGARNGARPERASRRAADEPRAQPDE